jgi:hypothetical protein
MLFVVRGFVLEDAFRLCCAAIGCLRPLPRRAWDIGIGAKDATISRLRPKQGAAAFAFIEKQTRVTRHCFPRFVAAVRACDRGNKDHVECPVGRGISQRAQMEMRPLDFCSWSLERWIITRMNPLTGFNPIAGRPFPKDVLEYQRRLGAIFG